MLMKEGRGGKVLLRMTSGVVKHGIASVANVTVRISWLESMKMTLKAIHTANFIRSA